MKTAEEWQNEFPYNCSVECEGNSKEQESFIKQIQLDAWKQGMTDAAKMVDNWHPFDNMDNVGLRDSITEKANNKTSI